MRLTTLAFIVATTPLLTASAALAERAPDCGRGQQHCTSQHSKAPIKKSDQSHYRNDRNTQHSNTQHAKGNSHKRVERGQRLDAGYVKRLPKLQRGQEYRLIDGRVTRVDSDTL